MICRAGKLTNQNKYWLNITNYDNNDPKSVDLNKRVGKILKKNIEFQFLKKNNINSCKYQYLFK